MPFGDGFLAAMSFASLSETRGRLRTRWGRITVAAAAAVFLLVSMIIGQMLILSPISGGYFTGVVYGGASQWWDYPGLLSVQSWGVLALPLFPTIAMVGVSVGVGIGAGSGVALLLPLLRRTRGVDRRGTLTGAAAGVGPAITGLATIGACCCTGCAGAVGVTIVAAASGSNLNELLYNNWYIGVFQLAVVYVSLLAQERAFRLNRTDCPIPPPIDRRYVAGAVLRMGLLVAGITWSLAMFVEWGDNPPLAAAAPTWYHWILEHQLLSLTAISAALFPKEFSELFRRASRGWSGRGVRIALGLAGWTWGIWVPSAAAGIGLGGFLNEAFGFAGVGVGWGAIPPDAALGAPLYFHWIFQHLLLSLFAIALAISPTLATNPLVWTVAGGRSLASAGRRGSGPGDQRPFVPIPAAANTRFSSAKWTPLRRVRSLRTLPGSDRFARRKSDIP